MTDNNTTTQKNIIDIFRERRERYAAEEIALCTPLQDGESHIPLLKPGTHATVSVGSDDYPYEVIGSTYFASGKKKGLVKTVTIRRLAAQAISGDYFAQDVKYEYTSDPSKELEEAKAFYKSDGTFRCIAKTQTCWGGKGYYHSGTIHFGVASKRLDPHL